MIVAKRHRRFALSLSRLPSPFRLRRMPHRGTGRLRPVSFRIVAYYHRQYAPFFSPLALHGWRYPPSLRLRLVIADATASASLSLRSCRTAAPLTSAPSRGRHGYGTSAQRGTRLRAYWGTAHLRALKGKAMAPSLSHTLAGVIRGRSSLIKIRRRDLCAPRRKIPKDSLPSERDFSFPAVFPAGTRQRSRENRGGGIGGGLCHPPKASVSAYISPPAS